MKKYIKFILILISLIIIGFITPIPISYKVITPSIIVYNSTELIIDDFSFMNSWLIFIVVIPIVIAIFLFLYIYIIDKNKNNLE